MPEREHKPTDEKEDTAVAGANSGSSSSNEVSPSEEESEDQGSLGPDDLLNELYRNGQRNEPSIRRPNNAAR